MLKIVTVFRFGHDEELGRTVESLIQQRHADFKVLFILSNAKPQNISVLETAINSRFSYSLTVNQDTSLYNAMNIALGLIPEGWIYFLNGGDVFSSERSTALLDAYKSNSHPILFSTIQTYENDKYMRPPSARGPAHQGFLVNRKQVGTLTFCENLKIAADHYWMLKLIQTHGCELQSVPIAEFHLGGISNYPSWTSIKSRLASQGFTRAALELFKFSLRKVVGTRLYYRIVLGRRSY